MSIHFHKLVITDVRKETPDCISVAFDLPEVIKPLFIYEAGQNVTVRTILNNEEIRRSYSICSSPHEKELRIAIKEASGGKFSTWANKEFVKGHVLEVLPPTGRFNIQLQDFHRKSYLAIAAGSGITPILSIISTTLRSEPLSSFTLIYGNRNRASIIFRDQLNAMKNRYMNRFALHHVLSREEPDAAIYSGRIDAEKCEALSRHLIDFNAMDEIFICGPGNMIFGLKDWLKSKGVAEKKIHFELFTTPVGTTSSNADDPDLSTIPGLSTINDENRDAKNKISDPVPILPGMSQITIRLDGLSFDFELSPDGESVLGAALAFGADLPFSCKGGVCGTCRAKLIEGKVSMERNYALEPEEVEAGYVLTCQSHPLSEKVVIDFDQK